MASACKRLKTSWFNLGWLESEMPLEALKESLMENISVASSEIYLSLKTFNQMANGHSRRDSVGIDNYIRSDTFTGKWHILKMKTDQNHTIFFLIIDCLIYKPCCFVLFFVWCKSQNKLYNFFLLSDIWFIMNFPLSTILYILMDKLRVLNAIIHLTKNEFGLSAEGLINEQR